MSMTADEMDELFKRMSKAYDDIVAVLDGVNLDRDEAFSLLAQILCQLSHDEKDEFMSKMNYFFTMERLMRPNPNEVH